MQQQSARSQTMSCLKYLTSVERLSGTTVSLDGSGTYLCTCVEDGDKLYLSHHTVSISKFSAHTELLSGRIWVSGQPFLSLFIMAIPGTALGQTMRTMSLLHLSTPIVYVFSVA